MQPGITIPAAAQSVTIGNDGTVTVVLPGQALPQPVGQLQTAGFINPAGLDPKGQNIYAETAASGTPEPRRAGPERRSASLQQGFVETSNVNVVEELVQMIQTQRAYELNSKAIQTSDQMLAEAGPAVRRARCNAHHQALRDRARCIVLCAAMFAALSGCEHLNPAPAGRRRSADLRRAAGRSSCRGLSNGSIFQSAQYRPLFEDYRARLVGDSITVQIVEKISATQKSTSSIDKSGSVAAGVTALPFLAANSFNRASAAGTSTISSPAPAAPRTATTSPAPSPPSSPACCPTATC